MVQPVVKELVCVDCGRAGIKLCENCVGRRTMLMFQAHSPDYKHRRRRRKKSRVHVYPVHARVA